MIYMYHSISRLRFKCLIIIIKKNIFYKIMSGNGWEFETFCLMKDDELDLVFSLASSKICFLCLLNNIEIITFEGD